MKNSQYALHSLIALLLTACFFCGLAWFVIQAVNIAQKPPVDVLSAIELEGRDVFTQHCSSCHLAPNQKEPALFQNAMLSKKKPFPKVRSAEKLTSYLAGIELSEQVKQTVQHYPGNHQPVFPELLTQTISGVFTQSKIQRLYGEKATQETLTKASEQTAGQTKFFALTAYLKTKQPLDQSPPEPK